MIELNLKGKVAFVTGASRGIGREIALTLASAGADVVCAATKEDLLKTVCAEIEKKGVRAISATLDVVNYAAFEKAIEATVQRLGRLDILVNNAGITRDSLILRHKEEDWNRVLDVNLKGVFNGIKAASRVMMKQRSGRIINISSISGLMGNVGQASYAASKAGIIALTKTAAREFASRGILINAVAPGFIETDMAATVSEEQKKWLFDRIPLQRFGKPSEVAHAVLFLAGDGASYITGQTLIVDGGMYS